MSHVKQIIALTVCGLLLLAAGQAFSQDWPQWRGPNRDNKVTNFAVPKTWPKELTKKWRVNVGPGEASPLLVGDKVYVFTRLGGDEVTLCLDAATGKELWKDKYATAAVSGGDSGHPGPRSAPALAEGKICTFGVNGVLSCLDAATGKLVWRHNNTGKTPAFHTACSPLIVDGMCIVYAGSLTAYDLANGATKWQAKSGAPPFGSPVLITVDGVKQVVTQTGAKTIVGVAMADGNILWSSSVGGDSITPVVDGPIVICSGPGAGTVALKIEKQGDSFTAKELWKDKQAATKYNTPVLRDAVLNEGLLFGISNSRNIFCLDAKTGKQLWTDATDRGECGHILNAGSVLIAVTTDCDLLVFEPSNKAYKELAKYEIADKPAKGAGKGAKGGGKGGFGAVTGPWACPIITGNRIFIRDQTFITLWTID